MVKITQKQADELILMLKNFLGNKEFLFPKSKGSIEFLVNGNNRNDEFLVNISRKGKKIMGCTYQGRIKSNNIVLVRLDINPSAVHRNPTGEIFTGSHIHFYTEEFHEKFAIPFNTDKTDIYEIRHKFYEIFNIIKPPIINYQTSLNDLGE